MLTTTLAKLHATDAVIDELRIRSIDPELYLVDVLLGDHSYSVVDDENHALKYRGVAAAKKPFADLTVAAAYLIHQSAYDEMIGLDGAPGHTNLMRIKISAADR